MTQRRLGRMTGAGLQNSHKTGRNSLIQLKGAKQTNEGQLRNAAALHYIMHTRRRASS